MIRLYGKRSAFVSAVLFFLVAAFIYTLIMKCGLIPGANAVVDQRIGTLERAAAKTETIEGSITDRYGCPITIAEEPGVPAQVLSESAGAWVGFNSAIYGVSGLRKTFYDDLFYPGKNGIGSTITTTIDLKLNEFAYQLLKGREGAIVVLEAETGAIRAMASRSSAQVDFDVNEVDANWDMYSDQPAFFYNRAVMVQDPPGSLNKPLVAAAMVENGLAKDFLYDDSAGEIVINGKKIHNFRGGAYGPNINLEKMLNHSVNTATVAAAMELGAKGLLEIEEAFGYNEEMQLDFTVQHPTVDLGCLNDDWLTAQTSFGQGNLRTSPLCIASTLATLMNDGVRIKPYLIEEIVTDSGKTTYTAKRNELERAVSAKTASQVMEWLHTTAVEYGFSEKEGFHYVVSKTGTADAGGMNSIYYMAGMDGYVVLVKECGTYQASGALWPLMDNLLRYIMKME